MEGIFMDLIKLKTFYTVARLGNFTRAAETLFFTQPAISLQIKELENEYRCRLFERIGKKVKLTSAGESLLPFAETILKASHNSFDAVSAVLDATSGRIRIGATGFSGVYVLPELITGFKSRYPEVSFDITLRYAKKIRKMILENKLDAGITGGINEPPRDPGLLEKVLARDQIVLVLGPGHRFWDRTDLRTEELADEPVILLPKITVSRQIIRKNFEQKHIPLRVEYEVSNIALIKRMVEKGLGLSFLCRSQIRAECSTGALRGLPFSDMHIPRTINLIYHRDKSLSPSLSLFIDYLDADPDHFQEILVGPFNTP
jgi:DNA-binding transcriptional LysR family regulator